MTDTVISQNYIGSVIMVSISICQTLSQAAYLYLSLTYFQQADDDAMQDEEEEEDDELLVLGLTTVLNLTERKVDNLHTTKYTETPTINPIN